MTNFSCIDIPEKHLGTLNSTEYLTQKDFNVPWFQLEKMFINFTLRTITFRKMGSMMGKFHVFPMKLRIKMITSVKLFWAGPACFLFGIRITFDNSDHDGQILVTLTTKPQRYQCPQSIQVFFQKCTCVSTLTSKDSLIQKNWKVVFQIWKFEVKWSWLQLEASVAAVGNRLLDTVVIVVCLVSLVLCGRALFRFV